MKGGDSNVLKIFISSGIFSNDGAAKLSMSDHIHNVFVSDTLYHIPVSSIFTISVVEEFNKMLTKILKR